MNCPKCQFENAGGIKFCGECGILDMYISACDTCHNLI